MGFDSVELPNVSHCAGLHTLENAYTIVVDKIDPEEKIIDINKFSEAAWWRTVVVCTKQRVEFTCTSAPGTIHDAANKNGLPVLNFII